MKRDASFKNSSGCFDMTAHDALENVAKEEERFKKLVSALFYIVEMAGFKFDGRFTLVDKTTGRVWR